jgi:hypothetical protein
LENVNVVPSWVSVAMKVAAAVDATLTRMAVEVEELTKIVLYSPPTDGVVRVNCGTVVGHVTVVIP